jgi:hypothetical protein
MRPEVALDRRAVRLPVSLPGYYRRAVLQVAAALIRGAVDEAAAAATELATAADHPEEDRIPATGAAALARLLVDLVHARWLLSIEAGDVWAVAPKLADVRSDEEMCIAKAAVRNSTSARVREQVASASTARLVEEIEPRILALIADPDRLAASLAGSGPEAVKPYLQPARRADGDDPHSGLPLYSIFRYLRYWWSFPFGDTPGRSLPVLIRDEGQPGHPVCGLLCLASPVLRMTNRDDALGLTTAWLEACVAALDVAAGDRRARLLDLERVVREQQRPGLSAERLLAHIATVVGVERGGQAGDIARRLARLPQAIWDARRAAAARRLARDLVNDLSTAIDLISLEGLGVTREEILAPDAGPALARLEDIGDVARGDWKTSRATGRTGRRAEDTVLLFRKKRAVQLLVLARGWADLSPIRAALASEREEAPLAALRAGTSRRRGPWSGETLTAGRHVSRGLSDALLARKVGFASTRISDISLCGAIPPYDALLGGKLAALLALSADMAAIYQRTYEGSASEIQSKMAGRPIQRPADLVALTTASLYGVGSSQYNRVRLPADLGGGRWDAVGLTAGHGTLHFSAEAVRLLAALATARHGAALITNQFGEGPSARLRKLREGMTSLGLPADELLQHGMNRISYVSVLRSAAPGAAPDEAVPHRTSGPSAADVATFWRSRWLAGRAPSAEDLRAFRPDDVLLSRRYPEEVARGRLAASAPAAVEELFEPLDLADEPDADDVFLP